MNPEPMDEQHYILGSRIAEAQDRPGFEHLRGRWGRPLPTKVRRRRSPSLQHPILALCLTCAALGWAAPARSAEPDTSPPSSVTSGLAIGTGLGYQYAMIGAQLLYYQQLGASARLTPYAGGGVFPSEGDKNLPGFSVGTMLILGASHRFVLDLNYGLAAVEGIKELRTGKVIDSRTVYGVTAAGGYEYMADGGFFVRPSLGATYFTDEVSTTNKKVVPTINIGLGYKFW